MKAMGYEINEDGRVEWRNNAGIVQRRFLYGSGKWEDVANTPDCPRTALQLMICCVCGGFGYEAPAGGLKIKRIKMMAPRLPAPRV